MSKEKVKGIGGWLIFPIITLFVLVFVLLYDLRSVNIIYELDFHKGLISFLDISFLIFAGVALFAIFNKKKYAPQIMISFYIANIVIQLVIAFLIGNFSRITAPIIGGAIWVPYFICSKRVKNTFVK